MQVEVKVLTSRFEQSFPPSDMVVAFWYLRDLLDCDWGFGFLSADANSNTFFGRQDFPLLDCCCLAKRVDEILKDAGIEPKPLPARSPNLNAYAERFVLTMKSECLNRMIFFGEQSLRRAASEFVEHYHAERNHQSLANELITPLEVYRERGHRRLDSRTYEKECRCCIWGCRMPVEIIVDQWKPHMRRYRVETFCYGPKSCLRHRPGPKRKVPGRKGMTWVEEDWVDEEHISHRCPDE